MNKKPLNEASLSLNVQEVMAAIFIAFSGSGFQAQDFDPDCFSAVSHHPKSARGWEARIPGGPQATMYSCAVHNLHGSTGFCPKPRSVS